MLTTQADQQAYQDVKAVNCKPNIPCEYPESVDFRIIVLTRNRSASLLKLLTSLLSLQLDGATNALEIWIDREGRNRMVHYDTLITALNFQWNKGIKRVHVQKTHVGIRGQWIDSWRPPVGKEELAVFLEDDITVSPYIWRWTKAVHQAFRHRDDILGYSLANQYMYCVGNKPFIEPKTQNIYLNRQMGSWGFIPRPKIWASFQDWYHKLDKSYQPWLGNGKKICYDIWFKKYSKLDMADSMWTIWFAKYAYENGLFCVYSNLAPFAGKNYRLALHRRENGLHFFNKIQNKDDELLEEWHEKYVQFNRTILTYEFDGKINQIDL